MLRDMRQMSCDMLLAENYVAVFPGNFTYPKWREFCPDCGSTVLAQPYKPEIIFIVTSSLDAPTVYEPSLELWTSSAQPWDTLNPDLRHFGTQFSEEELLQLAHF
jgi:hypothetical protein